MNTIRIPTIVSLLPAVILAVGSSVASAQAPNDHDHDQQVQLGEGTPPSQLPEPQSDNDPQPEVAAPVVPAEGVVEQAGVGGSTAYGRGGVLELGGHIGFNVASDITTLSIAPTVGWFFADNLELTGIVGLEYAKIGDVSSTLLQLLVEPSFHLPFSDTLFGFLGVGLGLAYSKDADLGFALAPRLGLNILVGRSGILTPAVQFTYSTNEVIQTPQGQALLAVSASFGFNLGYTVMW